MSFGVSIGDIVLLIRLTAQTHSRWKSVCGKYSNITSQLESLRIVLQHVERETKNQNSIFSRQHEEFGDIMTILGNCKHTVTELESIAAKYSTLGKIVKSRKQNWDKIRFACKNHQELCDQLTAHTVVLSAVLDAVSTSALGRVETKVDKILENVMTIIDQRALEMRASRRPASLYSVYDAEGEEAWRRFRRVIICTLRKPSQTASDKSSSLPHSHVLDSSKTPRNSVQVGMDHSGDPDAASRPVGIPPHRPIGTRGNGPTNDHSHESESIFHEQPFWVAYRSAVPTQEPFEHAFSPTIGICFLPGCEETAPPGVRDHVAKKGSLWKVYTAGRLLTTFDVNYDNSISSVDRTGEIVERLASRLNLSPNVGPDTNCIVLVESSNVSVSSELATEDVDLGVTLIEVDGSTLTRLLIRHRHLCGASGHGAIALRDSLLAAIEDVELLYRRSPALSRLSSRAIIASSREIRYGIDVPGGFMTLATSRRIKKILSWFCACYNSLIGLEEHKNIRSRFMRMLIILLSLLDNKDLEEMDIFLECTYEMRASRQDIELLVLKILPLKAADARQLLDSVVCCFGSMDGTSMPESITLPNRWRALIRLLISLNYILPRNLDQLGAPEASWMIEWPQEAFTDSTIFQNLQYAGQNRTFNEIPPLDIGSEGVQNWFSIVFVAGTQYKVSNDHMRQIQRMEPGVYTLVPLEYECLEYNLEITETVLDGKLQHARARSDRLVRRERSLFQHTDKEKYNTPWSDIGMSVETQMGGELTVRVANLVKTRKTQNHVATRFRICGSASTRSQAKAFIAAETKKIRAAVHEVEKSLQETVEVVQDIDGTKESIVEETIKSRAELLQLEVPEIYLMVNDVELANKRITDLYSDGPLDVFTGVIAPRLEERGVPSIWFKYQVRYNSRERSLDIDAEHELGTVSHVLWLLDDLIMVTLDSQPIKYYLSPLRSVSKADRPDEIQENDKVLLCGYYVVVVAPCGPSVVGIKEQPQKAVNWLRIVAIVSDEGVEIEPGRGRSKRKPLVLSKTRLR